MADLSDRALSDPAEDLLGVAPAAETLAKVMAAARLPYTVGIYGGWGEGKTTFAEMVVAYLGRQPGWTDLRLVRFSAWPYVTADAVWRALLEAIAHKVYMEPPADPADSDIGLSAAIDDVKSSTAGDVADGPEPTRARLRRLLLSEVLAVPAGKGSPPVQKYERLMQRLGKVSVLAARHAQDTATARQMSLLAGLIADVVTSVAVPVGPLRRLLGAGSEASESAANTSPAERIVASVEEARDSVRELFAEATEPRTVIIVDDLDRCMPDVALDVLETIKIFLSESTEAGSGCVFVVAVDQSILTRALHTRLGAEDPHGARAYLEKVVQFGIPLSAVHRSGPERLVAANYPQWNGTSDLLAIATDANPRRLKQQCELLSYGFTLLEAL